MEKTAAGAAQSIERREKSTRFLPSCLPISYQYLPLAQPSRQLAITGAQERQPVRRKGKCAAATTPRGETQSGPSGEPKHHGGSKGPIDGPRAVHRGQTMKTLGRGPRKFAFYSEGSEQLLVGLGKRAT